MNTVKTRWNHEDLPECDSSKVVDLRATWTNFKPKLEKIKKFTLKKYKAQD